MGRLGRNQRAALEAAAHTDLEDGTSAARLQIHPASLEYHVHAYHYSHELLHDTRAAYHVFKKLEERGLVRLVEDQYGHAYYITDQGREALKAQG